MWTHVRIGGLGFTKGDPNSLDSNFGEGLFFEQALGYHGGLGLPRVGPGSLREGAGGPGSPHNALTSRAGEEEDFLLIETTRECPE